MLVILSALQPRQGRSPLNKGSQPEFKALSSPRVPGVPEGPATLLSAFLFSPPSPKSLLWKQ